MMFRQFAAICLALISFNLFAPPTEYTIKSWAERTFDSLSVDERIAQLFMIEVRPTYGPAHLRKVKETIVKHQVGGLIFFKGDPVKQVELTNEYQALAKVPMMIAIDGEWGLAMRLSNTISYPYQIGLGSIQDNSLIEEMGVEIGRQCKRMGIHVNFAPVVDVNNNPKNPVINYRSFGEDPSNVASKGLAYAKGMQSKNVIACAKHFPGHGDTDVDSHKDLPVINHSMERLKSVEMKPFRHLIDNGVQSVMTAHLFIPAIDNTPNVAVSISEKAINGILRKDMGFTGLSFTDALNMQGVAKYHPDGELELKALMAGNDVLLAPGDIPKATILIKKAIVSGMVSEEYVWSKVKKILAYKYDLGLDSFEKISTYNLINDLNNTKAKYIKHKLVENQLCLVKDENNLIPLNAEQKIVSVAIGTGAKTKFQTELTQKVQATTIQLSKNAARSSFDQALNKLTQADIAIVSIHSTSKYPPNFGITTNTSYFVQKATQKTKVILVDFGNPYNLAKFPGQKSVLMAFEDNDVNQVKAVQALIGEIGVTGRLSVTVGSDYPVNSGVITSPTGLMNKAEPIDLGMNPNNFKEIDQIMDRAIRIGATPGGQVLVAKEGKIVYNKSFGKQTYTNGVAVENDHLYDLASITKVAATTLSIMKLVEDGVIDLDDKMAKYLPELIGSNKSYITIRMVLQHKAGLKAWIPFYYETIKDPDLYDSVYSLYPTATHNTYVGCGLYMMDSYKDHIFKQIIESDLGTRGKYKYSDLGMIMMKELIERVTQEPFNTYVQENFYYPMGLTHLTYLPLDKFDESKIVPTAMSPDMRKGIVHGFVHDPAAAMLGGVSGHAGLFGNAESLAHLMQMLLNGGEWNGMQYLRPETIQMFTKQQTSDSRRGLGWDKPEFHPRYINPASDHASRECFGHTGFTGTMVWVDPKYDLIYVFLSNRVYPDQDNKKLIREGVRTKIMDAIYESFL